jgi:DNA polymerase-3 subunit alpha
MSQFDKDDVEKIGLVKFDFLGLTTLTILDWAVKYVRGQDAGIRSQDQGFNLENIPLDDPATFAIFANGNTTAIFQSESKSARDLERRLKPDTFEDVIALMALNRPGPLQSGMVEDFIRRKHGRERAEYFHPSLEPVLKPTYGVIVYQEQVMQVAQILAGYSLGSADLLRRAMGKKKPEEMAKHRSIFVEGAAARGVDRHQAEHLFDLMEKFAEYGFNKSHSAAYALIAYQTAYLKAHYPAAFMAATLSAEMHDSDKIRLFYDDCIANGLAILPPDINLSAYRFAPVSEREIRYGLGAIKGTGESAIAEVLAAREAGGPFLDLFDFCRRVDKRVVNRRAIEAFIRAGAFDSLNDDRASLLASVGLSLDAAEQASVGLLQNSLFGEASPLPQVALKQAPRWSDAQRLQNEKAALGLYLSGHPFHGYRAELAALVNTRLADLSGQAQNALLAGIVAALRTQHSRRGRMAILTLDDATARVEVTVFSELYDAHRGWLKEDQLVLVEGRVSQDEYTGGVKVTAEKLYDLAAARNAYARRLRLELNGDANAEKLVATLKPFRRGPCPVSVAYHNGVAACDLELGEEWRVNLREELLQALKEWLPRVEIEYR